MYMYSSIRKWYSLAKSDPLEVYKLCNTLDKSLYR